MNDPTRREVAIQHHTVIGLLRVIHILPEYRFPAHHVHQPHIHGGQAAVSRHEVKTLSMVRDLRVVAEHRPGHHVIY